MSEGTPPPPPPPPAYGNQPLPGVSPGGKSYATWAWRVIAYIIDEIIPWILVLIGSALGWPSTEVVNRDIGGYSYTVTQSTGFGVFYYIMALLALAFYIWNKGYREGSTGKSIGKQMTGYTTVKEETGEPLGVGMGILRCVLLWVDFFICYIGVLWPLWDAKRQCLISDKATGAVVYKD